ncbi:hypothetical protein HDV05_003998 [Chytridiales sp. JEL 0842]|nr:hypothetical protein HDV05_003998 [Chytridiales sp. JEL 0842]
MGLLKSSIVPRGLFTKATFKLVALTFIIWASTYLLLTYINSSNDDVDADSSSNDDYDWSSSKRVLTGSDSYFPPSGASVKNPFKHAKKQQRPASASSSSSSSSPPPLPALPQKNSLDTATCVTRTDLLSLPLEHDDNLDSAILVTTGPAPFWIDVYPIKDDVWISKEISENGTWHLDLCNVIKNEMDCIRASNPKRPITFLDVGANIGFFSLFFAQYPRVKVISVEPFPSHFQKFTNSINFNGLNNIEPHNVALSDTPRNSVCMCANPTNGGNASVIACPASDKSCSQKQSCDLDNRCGVVPVTTLDNILKGRNVDIMKIDIEGYEALAIHGAARLFKSSQKPRLILMEYNGPMFPATPDPIETMVDLVGMGYEIQDKNTGKVMADAESVRDYFGSLKKWVPSELTDLVLRLVNEGA